MPIKSNLLIVKLLSLNKENKTQKLAPWDQGGKY